MAFWNSANSIVPAQSHRFIVEIPGLGQALGMGPDSGYLATFMAKSVSPLPGWRAENTSDELSQTGSTRRTFIRGKAWRVIWQPVTISFIVGTTSDTKQNLSWAFDTLLTEAGYRPRPYDDPDGANENYNPELMTGFFTYIHIHQLLPNGRYSMRYDLKDAIITGISRSGAAYDNSEVSTVDVEFSYGFCEIVSWDLEGGEQTL